MEPRLRRLSFSRVQYEYGFLTDGCACAFAMGEGHDDRAVIDFARHGGFAGGKGGEHSLSRRQRNGLQAVA